MFQFLPWYEKDNVAIKLLSVRNMVDEKLILHLYSSLNVSPLTLTVPSFVN